MPRRYYIISLIPAIPLNRPAGDGIARLMAHEITLPPPPPVALDQLDGEVYNRV